MDKEALLCYEKHPRWACGAVLAAGLRSWRIWDTVISQAIVKTF